MRCGLLGRRSCSWCHLTPTHTRCYADLYRCPPSTRFAGPGLSHTPSSVRDTKTRISFENLTGSSCKVLGPDWGIQSYCIKKDSAERVATSVRAGLSCSRRVGTGS